MRTCGGQQDRSKERLIAQDNFEPAETVVMLVLNALGIEHSLFTFEPSHYRL